jgi:hypothetical protein
MPGLDQHYHYMDFAKLDLFYQFSIFIQSALHVPLDLLYVLDRHYPFTVLAFLARR